MATMEELLALVNRLQQACTLVGQTAEATSGKSAPNLWNELPQIVVVGGQSSGKSSVLEAIVGRDFLPRGTGIVTRRPLVLQLVKTESGPDRGEFLHKFGETFTDFALISKEIEAETERTCKNKAVSPNPISLTVYSPDVPNLTLVDMPGLTKIPIGDQPVSITKDIEDMARLYIEGENAIILAVSPANSDLANSDAIKLAQEVDPSGERTIGVMTKLDIMDDGTDARDVLTGQTLPLKHGWTAVVNRSQADINGNKSMAVTRDKEMSFFKNHKAYADLVENTGTAALSGKLSHMLQKKIVQQIPKIKDFLQKNIAEISNELKELGEPMQADRAYMLHTILEAAQEMEKKYATLVDSGEEGGNKILRLFQEQLTKSVSEIPLDELYAADRVARIVDAADGWQKHLIAPEAGYRKLIHEGITTLEEPSLGCVQDVHSILSKLVDESIASIQSLSVYCLLRAELETIAQECLEEVRSQAIDTVATIIAAEANFLDTGNFKKLAQSANLDDENPIGQHCQLYVQMIFGMATKTIPKSIILKMVIASKEKLMKKFYQSLGGYDEKALTRLLQEDPELCQKRDKLSQQLELLTSAKSEVMTVAF